MTSGPVESLRHREPGHTVPTFGVLVDEVRHLLADAGIEAPRTEARDIVAAILDRPRFWPTLNAGQVPTPGEHLAIRDAAARRVAGAPFAYAVRRAAFRFLTLEVDERVLIPRPETERLVELVLGTPRARAGGTAVDVGTGSGAIALALASEGRFGRVIAIDVSSDALAVARANAMVHAASLRAPIEFRVGNALAPLRQERVDVIVSNPPYIAWHELADLPSLVRDWEPPPALCCDDEGLAVTRQVVSGAGSALHPGGLLALEVDVRRAFDVKRLVEGSCSFEDVQVLADYTGRDRFVLATRRPFT